MNIEIKNCNNIDLGVVKIYENNLNIKYAINGTGKSTISKAICNSVDDRENGTNKLYQLIPFKAIGNETIQPVVTGTEAFKFVKIFDENYINDFTFQSDELLKGSFDIFIRGADYDAGINEIETLVAQVKVILSEDGEIDELIRDFHELSASFGKETKTGAIHASSAIAKGFGKGNKVTNIPNGLEIYKEYIEYSDIAKWLKWQIEGGLFIDITNNCPYCVNDITTQKETIKKVGEIYEVKSIENLNKIISVFQSLNKYFSDNTKIVINDFIKNIDGYTDDQVAYLKEVKDQIDRLYTKFNQAKNISFSSLKDVDRVIDHLNSYVIDINLFNHLLSQSTVEKVAKVNGSIEQLLLKSRELQGKINRQKILIENLVEVNKETINSFLRNAGYRYRVNLIEDEKKQHKLKLIPVDVGNENIVSDVKARLSYGERNAFALVLFMFDALKTQPELIVLDDPISSFDKNKKYAIVDMLFKRTDCFRGKTVLLLTHDFEPIVDMLYHHCNRFAKPFVTFLENNSGTLNERTIEKSDIQTFIAINEKNVISSTNIINKLVYLRRIYEITKANDNDIAYQLVSNLFHKRPKPKIKLLDEGQSDPFRLMTKREINKGTKEIKRRIPEFNYQEIIELVCDDSAMKDLYRQATNNYEKLHTYRIIFDDKNEIVQSNVIQKFINQAFHIENDYIYQLDPSVFQTVPQYVIDECDKFVDNGLVSDSVPI